MFYSGLRKIWKIVKIAFLLLSVFLIFLILFEVKSLYVKLEGLHPYIAYSFGVILSIVAGWLILNILSILQRKPVITLCDSDEDQKYMKLLIKFAKHLSKNPNIDEGDKVALEQGIKKINKLKKEGRNLKEVAKNFKSHDIDPILEKLDKKVKNIISDSVVKVAALTLIPNRISDFFFATYVSVNMIYKISKIYDSRPKLKEGFLIVEDVIAVMSTSAIVNLINKSLGDIVGGLLNSIPVLGGISKAGGRIINEGSQAIAVGFMTSVAGHSAHMRFRPLQQGNSEQIKNSILEKAQEYYVDVKNCVWRLLGRKKGAEEKLGKIDSFMLGSNGSILLNKIFFYTLFQEVQREDDDNLKKRKQRYLDRFQRGLSNVDIGYDYKSGKYDISYEKIIEDLKKLSEREKSILFIETCIMGEYGIFSSKKFRDYEFSKESIKKEIEKIANDSGKSEDFINNVWETKKEAEKAYKGLFEKFWPFAVGGIATGVLIPVTGVPAIIGGIVGSGMGLSGAAAVNAGLALLGGGSLAAGGFGMAGGATLITGSGAALGGISSGIIFSKMFSKKIQVGKLIEQCYLKVVLLDEENNTTEAQQLIERQQDEIDKIEEEIEEMENSEEEDENIKKQIKEAKECISIVEKAIKWEKKQISISDIITPGEKIPGIDVCKACQKVVRKEDAVTGADGLLYHKQCLQK